MENEAQPKTSGNSRSRGAIHLGLGLFQVSSLSSATPYRSGMDDYIQMIDLAKGISKLDLQTKNPFNNTP